MADPHTADAHDSHDAYAHGTQEISEQVATFSLFQGLAKWGSLGLAAVLAFLTIWFMPGGSFMAGAIVFVVMVAGGGFFLRSPKSEAH
ncbi:aa3-type cytochrome c oxidase subunit IV [Brevundimonas sp.]